jgi:hypothetical protein
MHRMNMSVAVQVVRSGFLHDGCPDRWCECDAARTIAELIRPTTLDRDTLGRHVREQWVRWAQSQPNPKPSWLVPYDELSEADKEADRQIGEHIYLLTKLHCEVAVAMESERTLTGAASRLAQQSVAVPLVWQRFMEDRQ